MLGIVFTELLEMVEERFSMETVDLILESTQTKSDGSYTAVGHYNAAEALDLVGALSAHTGIPTAELVRSFGHHLFSRLVEAHPGVTQNLTGSIELIEHIESHIHVSVRKLYPHADLPYLEATRPGPNRLVLKYASTRPLADLAHGLLEGCADYFGETLLVTHLDTSGGVGTSATFELERVNAK